MEGMIWNANNVLDAALSAKSNGVPQSFVVRCKGVVLLTIKEAGLILSGNSGTGVIMAQNAKGEWSPPSAIGMTGISLGLLVGWAVKYVLIFLMDEELVKKAGSGTLKIPKLTGESAITTGEISRMDDLDTFRESKSGAWGFMYSKGMFGSIAIKTVNLHEHKKQNAKFYAKDNVTPKEILLDQVVSIPKGSGIPDLHRKLEMLQNGRTSEPTPAELERKENQRVDAEEAGESMKAELDVGELQEADSAKEVEAAKKVEAAEEPDTTEEADSAKES